jgi:hypothetical protein
VHEAIALSLMFKFTNQWDRSVPAAPMSAMVTIASPPGPYGPNPRAYCQAKAEVERQVFLGSWMRFVGVSTIAVA